MKGSRKIQAREALPLLGALVAFCVAVWLYARFGFATLSGIASDSMLVHLDFDIFRRSARAWLDGGNAFRDPAPDISNNPPLWTLVFSPLALMEPLTAYRLWVPLMVLAQAASLAWVADELRMRAGPAALAVGGLLASAPLLGTLAIGQMYPVLTLGLAAAWALDRKGRTDLSGIALGLTVALKPSLAPVVLWPLARRRWRQLAATLAAGGAAMFLGAAIIGFRPTLDWLSTLGTKHLDGTFDNASLPGLAAMMFRENRFAEPLATPPYALAAATLIGLALIGLTAYRASGDTGLWAIAAASLLASPVTWHNYLPVLAPGVLVLIAKGKAPAGMLLLALALVPQSWTALWEGKETAAATLALGLYGYVLLAYWLALTRTARD